jgi:hypothetical protein
VERNKFGVKAAEIVFDAAYLAAVAVLSVMLARAGGIRRVYGLAGFVLLFGDSLHLLPRMFRLGAAAMGFGKAAASVTMTLFYLILARLLDLTAAAAYAVYALGAVRVTLCLLPQNRWLSGGASVRMSAVRNAPFVIIGLIVAAGFTQASAGGGLLIGVMILISFACYLPVVFWAGRKPAVGMLMLPKSAAYAAVLLTALLQ